MPNAPGSSIDVLGRIAAQKLGAARGEQMVVENRAGGIIGMEGVKTASADGYTLVAASTAAMTIISNLRTKLPYAC
jgi:tripartite-type tricarboxylate transporter receptor subunit TctC